jgi:hypothetical protein
MSKNPPMRRGRAEDRRRRGVAVALAQPGVARTNPPPSNIQKPIRTAHAFKSARGRFVRVMSGRVDSA